MAKLQKTSAVNVENVKTAVADFYKTSKEYLDHLFQFNKG